MGDKQINPQSEESEKNKNSDSKVFYLIEPSDKGIEALSDEIYGPEEEEEST